MESFLPLHNLKASLNSESNEKFCSYKSFASMHHIFDITNNFACIIWNKVKANLAVLQFVAAGLTFAKVLLAV